MHDILDEERQMEGKIGDKIKKFLAFVPVYPEEKAMTAIEISRRAGVRGHAHQIPIFAPIFEEDNGKLAFMSRQARDRYFKQEGILIPGELNGTAS